MPKVSRLPATAIGVCRMPRNCTALLTIRAPRTRGLPLSAVLRSTRFSGRPAANRGTGRAPRIWKDQAGQVAPPCTSLLGKRWDSCRGPAVKGKHSTSTALELNAVTPRAVIRRLPSGPTVWGLKATKSASTITLAQCGTSIRARCSSRNLIFPRYLRLPSPARKPAR